MIAYPPDPVIRGYVYKVVETGRLIRYNVDTGAKTGKNGKHAAMVL